VSPQVEAILGFTPDEWRSDPNLWTAQVHPDDLERVLADEEASRRTGEPFLSEHRIHAKDGRTVWVHDEAIVVRGDDGSPTHLQGVMVVITTRKEAEAQLLASDAERRELMSRLVQAQEDERKRIAADVHDDSIQTMSGVHLYIEGLRAGARDAREQKTLAALSRTVHLAIRRLRNLVFDLRPQVLDEYGLGATIEQLLVKMQEETVLRYELEDRLESKPSPERRVILNRIAQEALTNVRKHATASRVRVRLEDSEGGTLVTVADDGQGFQRDAEANPGHLGLASMRERAEMAGGWWRLAGTPRAGTRVEFWIPS